jgi:hypothetical protein
MKNSQSSRNLYLRILMASVWVTIQTFAQGVGINPSGTPPHPSAILDLQSSQQGFLPPRLTTVQRDAIQNPAPGLRIFNLTTLCENYFNGNAWYELCGVCTPPVPVAPTAISGPASGCTGDTLTYSVNAVPNAASYLWTIPAGWTLLSGVGTTSIAVVCGTVSGNISVQASNGCGNSALISRGVSVGTIPNSPTQATLIPGQTQVTWQWNPVAQASGYAWNTTNNFSTANQLGNTTTFVQTGLSCQTNQTIYVWAYQACGASSPLVLNSQTLPCCTTFTGTLVNGLLSYHKLCGNLNDVSGNVRHGVNPNAIALTTDKNGVAQYAYTLQQAQSFFDFPNPGVANYSMSVWIRPSSVQPSVDILQFVLGSSHSEHSQTLRTNANGFLEHRVWHGGEAVVTSSIQAQANTWYHLVATAVSGGQMKLFINGQLVGTAPLNTIWTLGDMFRVGKSNRSGSNQGFVGVIDEMAVWNRELTNSEVTSLFNAY